MSTTDELDSVTQEAIAELQHLSEQAEVEAHDAVLRAKVLRDALFHVRGAAAQAANRPKP